MHLLRCSGAGLALVAALALAACNEADATEVRLRQAPVTPLATAPKAIEDLGPHPADDRVNVEQLAADTLKNKKPGQNLNWVPKEFTGNMAKWKDSGLYVDGKPLGFLNFGELPIGLKPTWLKDRVSADKEAGTSQPGWKWARHRIYTFNDYFKAVGIDIHQIKEVHVYSAQETQTLIVPGKDLLRKDAGEFFFWFGSITSGKAIPHIPDGFGNGKCGDKISSVMVYLKKKPPTLIENDGLYLDGVRQEGVPYYGEPVRGGVRVYLDDKLATIIKRQELDPKQAVGKTSDGDPQWRLTNFLKAHGVDTRKVVELWVVRQDTRQEKFTKAQLPALTFEASSQSRGGVTVGDQHVLANSIALHTHALKPSDMPLPNQPDE